jgi:hypothetical protein
MLTSSPAVSRTEFIRFTFHRMPNGIGLSRTWTSCILKSSFSLHELQSVITYTIRNMYGFSLSMEKNSIYVGLS